jgi:hypothetical protein
VAARSEAVSALELVVLPVYRLLGPPDSVRSVLIPLPGRRSRQLSVAHPER